MKSQKETPPRWAECSVTDWPLQTLLTDSCQHPVDRIPASSVLATAGRHGVKQFLGLIQGVISFVSLTALDESSSSHKSSPRAQIHAFRVWPSKSWVQLKKILEERLKDFLHFAWWIPRVIRQPQAAWCMWMCCLPLACRVTSWNKLKKTCSGWLLPKNQGAFAMSIQNKWKLCLKTHSCSSFAIFSITPSVRTLSCWDNWKGFHIAASSRITDVGCVNKGKHACTSYLMLSCLDVKQYCGKPFSISVLLLFYSPPSLVPFHCKGMCFVTEVLVHFKNMFSVFYLRDTIAWPCYQLREVQGGKEKILGTRTQVSCVHQERQCWSNLYIVCLIAEICLSEQLEEEILPQIIFSPKHCKSQWRYCRICKSARGTGIYRRKKQSHKADERSPCGRVWLPEQWVLDWVTLTEGLQYSLDDLSGPLVISVTRGVFVDKVPLLRQHCWNFSYVGFHTAWTKHARQPGFVIVAYSDTLSCVLKYLWRVWW